MDHLDGKPTLTNLFADFWKPLILSLKVINPNIKIVAEQANWEDYGFEYFEKATVDRMFGFGLQKAILAMDKQKIIENAEMILRATPAGKEQFIFIENHDIDRFASLDLALEKQKLAAAMMLLMGGIPSIYYGQEIGMKGTAYAFGNTDGNDIGRREAFDWYQGGAGEGMAFWYENSGAWWTNANLKPNDGISLEEQMNNPGSLFDFYKNTIALKQRYSALAIGAYENAPNNNDQVFSFYRKSGKQKMLLMMNLSNETQRVTLSDKVKGAKNVSGNNLPFQKDMTLAPFQWAVWQLR
jgi:glycosidase